MRLALLILLFGCHGSRIHNPPPTLDLAKWNGRQEEELFSVWGQPDSISENEYGHVLYYNTIIDSEFIQETMFCSRNAIINCTRTGNKKRQ